MKDLLQRLWDEFGRVANGVSEAIDGDCVDICLLDEITSDTDKMAKLRRDLFDAGIQNIPGFDYSAKEHST